MPFVTKKTPTPRQSAETIAPTIDDVEKSQRPTATLIQSLSQALQDELAHTLPQEAPPVAQSEPTHVQGGEEDRGEEDRFIQFEVPEYPKSVYDAAHIENEMMNFQAQIGRAMHPPVKEYTPPPVPPALAEATRLEMEAGRKNVERYASEEAKRRALSATSEGRRHEPWESRTTEIFRPLTHIPDPRAPDRTGTLRTIHG